MVGALGGAPNSYDGCIEPIKTGAILGLDVDDVYKWD